MYIGNIVSNNKDVFDKFFNITNNIEDINHELPTLVVGWDIVKTINPDVDFIDRKLSNNIFWTFKKIEKRDLFNDDLYDFTELCCKKLIENIKYTFIDFIQFSEIEIKNIFKSLKINKDAIGLKHRDMIYIYTNNIIYGIDLNLLSYLGYDVSEKINKIKQICVEFLIDEEILIRYKDITEMLGEQVKYIPYLYSLSNEKKHTNSVIHI